MKRILLPMVWLVSLGLVLYAIEENLLKTAACLGLFLAFCAWGHLLVSPLYYRHGRFFEGFVWGTISGMAVGAFLTSVIIYAAGWNLPLIFGCTFVLPSAVLFLQRRKAFGKRSLPGPAPDRFILFAALCITTFFFYLPFRNLGTLVQDKHLYAWLFAHDFINRMVHVTSLSQGIPLDGYFFAGETLNYYWLAYVYPALLSNLKWFDLETKQILQLTVLVYSLLTVTALVVFLDRTFRSRKIVAVSAGVALCCYSYVGVFTTGLSLLQRVTGGSAPHLFGYDLGAFSGFSHSFYRFFLVEPQGTMAIAVILMIFSVYQTHSTRYAFFLIGLLLGLLLGVEAMNGIMLLFWFVLYGGLRSFAKEGERIRRLRRHGLSLLSASLIYGTLFWMGMYTLETGSSALRLKSGWPDLFVVGIYLPLMYGPMFFFGAAGLHGVLRRERLVHWGHAFMILFGVAVLSGLFIAHPTEPYFGLFKAARVFPICLLVFTGYRLQSGRTGSLVGKVGAALLVLAFPSLLTDNLTASNISNPATYVRAADMEAARWIKRNLPRNGIVQAEPNYPGVNGQAHGKFAYSFIPIFAERRTAVGEWKVSSQEHRRPNEVSERFHAVRRAFVTTDLKECLAILRKYRIEYLYVGELERRLYRDGINKFHENACFVPVYREKGVSLFRYDGS